MVNPPELLPGARGLHVTHLNARISRKLLPALCIKVLRRDAVVAKKPADAVGGQIALMARIEEQGSASVRGQARERR